MTCRERLRAEYPDCGETRIRELAEANCPSDYCYMPDPEWCKCPEDNRCVRCWDREIPEVELNMEPDEETEDRPVRRNPKVICISGKARHGKDTTATFLRDLLECDDSKVLITHYGDLVKYICMTFFGWNGEKDEAGRALLQRVGTDEVRAQRPTYWVDFVVSILQMFPNEWDYILIPDCRFPNEIDSLREAGFDVTHIRVIRAPFISPLTPEQQMHPSETALDGVKADIYIPNFGSLGDLVTEIEDRVIPFIDEEVK